MSDTQMMRAMRVSTAGGAFEKTLVPRPSPAAGEVLVRIHASGVNPLDAKIRAGEAPHARHPFPAILGMDLSGVVESVGTDVGAFHAGDEVYGLAGGVGGIPGSLAEYAVVDADLLAAKPANLSMREAAALPLVIITAWEGLVDQANIKSGQKVLVHGGAGGVGHVAVQMARAFGAEVFATASAKKAEIVRSFGAVAIDYTTTTVEQYVADCTGGEGFDVVYDTVGGLTLDASFSAIRIYGGHVVSCLGWGTHKLAPLSFRAGTYSGVFTLLPLLSGKGRSHHGQILREASKLIEAGKIVPLMNARRFNLTEVAAAHDELVQVGSGGRIVVELYKSV
jgi:NADPH:quinone reductase